MDSTKELFTAKECAAIIGVTPRTLRKYELSGLIQSTTKKGTNKIYTRANIKCYYEKFPPEIWESVKNKF